MADGKNSVDGAGEDLIIGVLALQGAYDAHAQTLRRLGATPKMVRLPADLEGVDGLIMPGGESTTMLKFLEQRGFFDVLKEFTHSHPTFGTCAGVILLANEVTKLCHGDRAAKQAAETAKKTFEQGGVGTDIPTYTITSAELGKGIAAYELFRQSGLADSGGDAKRLIRGGGARINDQKVEDENERITPAYFKDGEIKLSAGKKKHLLVKLV